MKCLMKILLAAVAGAAVGGTIRQQVESRHRGPDESTELVIAASPVGIGAGLIAGLLLKSHPLIAAFLVAANVGANVDSGAMSRMAERFRSGD